MDALRRTVIALAACAALAAGASLPHAARAAEDYPSHPVRLVVPFPAGGPTDVVGRLFAEKLTAIWGKQVIVDNRPGASGTIGADIVAKSNPDGYTILFGSTSTFAVNGALMKHLPYDMAHDFALIGLAANGPHVLMVRKGFPAKTAVDFIALAKKEPGKLKYGSAGAGTIIQMAFELFKYYAHVDIRHIPYKGGGPSVVALLGGEVDVVLNDLSVLLPHIKAGRGVPLAVANKTRLAPLPDVPTFPEIGYPDIIVSTWFGVAVPAKTPAAVRARIAKAQNEVLTRADYKERLSTLAMEPLVMTPQQTSAFLKSEIAKWKKVADEAGISIQ